MAASPTLEEPGHHNYFMIGLETLYLSHMPMFTMEKHCYQVILRAKLPDEVMAQYVKERRAGATSVYNVINSEDDPYVLPQLKAGRTSFKADVYRDYVDEAPADEMFSEVLCEVEDVVHLRHFDVDVPYPENLTYLIFGNGDEAHIEHYIQRDPDFQHIMSLAAVPDWISPEQLQASEPISFAGVPSAPTPCSNPLTEGAYDVLYGGTNYGLSLSLAGATEVWFSTANLLNAKNPCGGPT